MEKKDLSNLSNLPHLIFIINLPVNSIILKYITYTRIELTKNINLYIFDYCEDNIHWFNELDYIYYTTLNSTGENYRLLKLNHDFTNDIIDKIIVEIDKYINNYIKNIFINDAKNNTIDEYFYKKNNDNLIDVDDINLTSIFDDIDLTSIFDDITNQVNDIMKELTVINNDIIKYEKDIDIVEVLQKKEKYLKNELKIIKTSLLSILNKY